MSIEHPLILCAYLAIVGVLSIHGLHRLFIVALYLSTRVRRAAGTAPGRVPMVTVQLPVFNEAKVVERLIDAACRLDWPHDCLEVQILDDSTDGCTPIAEAAAERWRRQGVDVSVLHRADRTGYKAGALAAGMRVARGELLAIFDADFVPSPDFLRRVVPSFDGFETTAPQERPRIGMVQARWGHLNEGESLLTRLSALLLDGHFVLEHSARHRSGRFFNFNGTAGVWRRTCIEEAGGWTSDTLTEDLDLSYRAQLAGWAFVYLQDVLVPAELPADIAAFKVQQHRWAKGTLQTARKLLPRILRAPLPLAVRSEAVAHLTSNLAYPLVLAMAILLPLVLEARPPADLGTALLLDLPPFLLATGSIGIFYSLATREAHGTLRGRLWRLPLVMALGIGIAVNQSRAVIEGLFGHDRTFLRTPKTGGDRTGRARSPLHWTALPELLLCLYFVLAIDRAVERGHWLAIPFLVLFAVGFGGVGLGSVRAALGPPSEGEGDDNAGRAGGALAIGDLSGSGSASVVVGASSDTNGGNFAGAVWIWNAGQGR